jgi:peptidoglycan/LPS O-acetylase OafA/YrhL
VGEARVVHTHPERFAPAHHGFAWIRMFGALLVIYGHSSPLVGTGDLFPASWAVQPEKGVLMGFFAMSGFQIAESWLRDPHPLRFATKRVLRLWPPMLVVVVVMALVVGPLVTDLRAGSYFSDPGTWDYIVRNAGMLTLIHVLPGVFVHNPWPVAVNGSLWTLPMELLAYAGLYVLLLLGGVKQQRRWMVVAAVTGFVIWDRYLDHIPGAESAGALLSVPIESLVAFVTAFGIGVILCVYRIPLSPTAAIVGLAVLFLMPNSEAASFWMRFAVSYTVVLVAHYWPARLRVPSTWVNGSYGVYVWGFPIQQLLATAGIRNQFLMLTCAAPIAYVMGTLSWKFVEEPTMRLRHLIAPERPKTADKPAEPAAVEEEPEDEAVLADIPVVDPVDDPDPPEAEEPMLRRPPPTPPVPVEPPGDNELTRYIPRMPRRYVAEESPLTRQLASNADVPPVPRLNRSRGRHAAPEPGLPDPEEQTRPMPPTPRRFDRR